MAQCLLWVCCLEIKRGKDRWQYQRHCLLLSLTGEYFMKNQKNTILIIRSNPVSPDSRVEKEANSLIKEGFSVSILAWDRNNDYKIQENKLHLRNGTIMVFRIGVRSSFGEGFKNFKSFIIFQIKMAKWLILNKNSYSIIHACDFDTAFVSLIISKALQKKMVFEIFDYLSTNPSNLFRKFIKKVENWIINNADAVIICSEKRIHQIEGTYPKKIVIMHNSPENISKEVNTKKQNISSKNKISIVYVGILQDHRLLMEICESISKMKNFELHIGGFGKYENSIREMADKYENIVFYGKIPYDKTIGLESKCDIMIAIYDPSISNHYYAAPNKFYEALMLGKPLIMVRGTGMSEILEKNNIGELMEYSQKSFECALKNLMNKKTSWEAMGIKMQQIYTEEFSWAEMEKRLVRLYIELTKM